MPTIKDYYNEFVSLRDRANCDKSNSALDVASLFMTIKEECGEEVDAACENGDFNHGDVAANDVVG